MSSNNNPELWTKLEQAQNYLMHAGKLINEVQYALKTDAGQQTQPTQVQKPTQPASTTGKKLTIEDVKKALPADLVDRLDIAYREAGKIIMVKPIAFLGSDNFAKVAQAIKNNLGGQYISAGKQSHFEVPL